MTLYDKLTEAKKDKLEQELGRYPNLYKAVVDTLKEHKFPLLMPLTRAIDIHTVFYPHEPFAVNNLVTLFE